MRIKALFTITCLALCQAAGTMAADIVVTPGDYAIENALQQAR